MNDDKRKARERLHGVLLGARSHMRMHAESAEAFEEYEALVRAPLEARIGAIVHDIDVEHGPATDCCAEDEGLCGVHDIRWRLAAALAGVPKEAGAPDDEMARIEHYEEHGVGAEGGAG